MKQHIYVYGIALAMNQEYDIDELKKKCDKMFEDAKKGWKDPDRPIDHYTIIASYDDFGYETEAAFNMNLYRLETDKEVENRKKQEKIILERKIASDKAAKEASDKRKKQRENNKRKKLEEDEGKLYDQYLELKKKFE